MQAREPKPQGEQPKIGRRFVIVRIPLVCQGHPISRAQHLFCNLSASTLVGIPKWIIPQAVKKDAVTNDN